MQKPEVTEQNKAKALELLKTGLSVRATAKAVGVTPQAICLWTLKDPEFNQVWEASVIANHMAVVAVHNENIEDFRAEVREARKSGEKEEAPFFAIEEKLVSRGIVSSLGVLSKIAKGWADNQNLNNNLSGRVEGKVSIINLEGVKPDATSND